MQKLLDLLGLGKIEYSFSDFESKLQRKYIKNFALDLLLSIICIIFLVTTKYYKGVIIFIFAILLLLFSHLHAVLQLLCGKVYCMEGKVLSDEKKAVKEKILLATVTILGTSKIKVAFDGNVYSVPVGHNMSFESGSKVRVYFYLENISEIAENEFDVIDPILVTKIVETE